MKSLDTLLRALDPRLTEAAAAPVLLAVLGLYALLAAPQGPCARCRGTPCLCPPVRYRTAGAWRGPGSFGKAPFGSQVRHR